MEHYHINAAIKSCSQHLKLVKKETFRTAHLTEAIFASELRDLRNLVLFLSYSMHNTETFRFNAESFLAVLDNFVHKRIDVLLLCTNALLG